MDLPADLRRAVEDILAATPLTDLQRASGELSRRYRAEVLDGRSHLSSALSANAYLAARLPATFAAVGAAMERIGEHQPAFAPESLLDVGAGPGTATFAAATVWSSLTSATLVEASASIREVGEKLAAQVLAFAPHWVGARAAAADFPPSDLVTLAYVLDEMTADEGRALVARLWTATRGILLIVEPGTPAGWRRILAARADLIAAGGHLLAPCPHGESCPLVEPDWCHFAQRLARSRSHRLTKGGEAPFEDEKFIYLAVSRAPGEPRGARILAMPRASSGKVQVKLCQPDGTAETRLVTRREGEIYKRARRSMWGDALSSAED